MSLIGLFLRQPATDQPAHRPVDEATDPIRAALTRPQRDTSRCCVGHGSTGLHHLLCVADDRDRFPLAGPVAPLHTNPNGGDIDD